MLEQLIGSAKDIFASDDWPAGARLFRADPEWFAEFAALEVFTSPEVWLDRAPELASFVTPGRPLSRTDARARYEEGESIYILGLSRVDDQLHAYCDELAGDLGVPAWSVSIEAWAAGAPTDVRMHYDHDYNFNVQIMGDKTWRTAANSTTVNPLHSYHLPRDLNAIPDGTPLAMPADAAEWDVSPGNVTWLPRGTWHETKAPGPTVAAAFVVKPATWAEVVAGVLTGRLHRQPEWRERMFGAGHLWRHTAVREQMERALNDARDEMAAITAVEALFEPMWGGPPKRFRTNSKITLLAVESDEFGAVLQWVSDGHEDEIELPEWGVDAFRYLARAEGEWTMVDMQERCPAAVAPFLTPMIDDLKTRGVLDEVTS